MRMTGAGVRCGADGKYRTTAVLVLGLWAAIGQAYRSMDRWGKELPWLVEVLSHPCSRSFQGVHVQDLCSPCPTCVHGRLTKYPAS